MMKKNSNSLNKGKPKWEIVLMKISPSRSLWPPESSRLSELMPRNQSLRSEPNLLLNKHKSRPILSWRTKQLRVKLLLLRQQMKRKADVKHKKLKWMLSINVTRVSLRRCSRLLNAKQIQSIQSVKVKLKLIKWCNQEESTNIWIKSSMLSNLSKTIGT